MPVIHGPVTISYLFCIVTNDTANRWCLNPTETTHGQAFTHPKRCFQKALHKECKAASKEHASSGCSHARRHPPVTPTSPPPVTCYHPIKGFRSLERNPTTGRYGITFNATKALIEGSSLALPCGRCIGCRIDKSRQWALRCHHEAQMHESNCFVTLTYDDQHVPQDYSVKLRDWQLFMKRLRKKYGNGIRFLASGEYGGRFLRPHYHALIFGHDFKDKVLFRTNKSGDRCYTSAELKELWPYGQHELGNVTFKSARYVAGYIMKKMTGTQADAHYTRVSPIDGQTYRVATEFCVMSRRPGLGTSWFDKFRSDAFPSDFLIVDGRKVKPPAFYLDKLVPEDEKAKIQRNRKRFALKQRSNNTKARLAVREEVQQIRAQRLLRELES